MLCCLNWDVYQNYVYYFGLELLMQKGEFSATAFYEYPNRVMINVAFEFRKTFTAALEEATVSNAGSWSGSQWFFILANTHALAIQQLPGQCLSSQRDVMKFKRILEPQQLFRHNICISQRVFVFALVGCRVVWHVKYISGQYLKSLYDACSYTRPFCAASMLRALCRTITARTTDNCMSLLWTSSSDKEHLWISQPAMFRK